MTPAIRPAVCRDSSPEFLAETQKSRYRHRTGTRRLPMVSKLMGMLRRKSGAFSARSRMPLRATAPPMTKTRRRRLSLRITVRNRSNRKGRSIMLSWKRITSLLFVLLSLLLTSPAFSQNTEMVQVGPPPFRRAEPPAQSASAEELEGRGDQLRAEKSYLDAKDYYEAAVSRSGATGALMNKMGICD